MVVLPETGIGKFSAGEKLLSYMMVKGFRVLMYQVLMKRLS